MDETEASSAEEAQGAEAAQAGRKHVFAVNGHADFLNAIRGLFESESYNVTTTNYVPQTFHQVVALKPDVVIVDLSVGVRAGWVLLERLHEDVLTNGIPVVVVSSDPRLLERARASTPQYGGQRFLPKPFDLDDMLAAIEELIGTA